MEIKHHTKNMLHLPLGDLLDKFYSAVVLKQFGEAYLFPLFPELASMDKVRKGDLSNALQSLQKDRKKLKELIQSLPGPVLSALETLLWSKEINLEELESRLGFELAKPVPQQKGYRYRDCPFELLPGLELVAIGESRDWYSRYSPEAKKSDYRLLLPPAIRRLLKPGFPKPAHYTWQVREFKKDLPSEVCFYNAESNIASDLASIGDFLNRGNLKITKAGKIAVGSLRTVMDLTRGGEFFKGSHASRKLPELRHVLLLQSLLRLDDKLTNLLVREPFPARKVFRSVVNELLLNGELLLDLLLPHLKPSSSYYGLQYKKTDLKQLTEIFSSLPETDWVSSDNLVEYPVFREIDLLFFNYRNYRFRPDSASQGLRRGHYYSSLIDLDRDVADEIVLRPLLLGSAFLLAAFGLLEIAYTPPPKNLNWRIKGELFLSPFDGLIGLRMTPLGAFAFGKTKTLNIAIPEKRTATVHLHPERLMATCRGADPLTIKAMEEFMEKLTPELYRFTPGKLLAGCSSKADLRERIEAFRKRIPAEVPKFWEATFRELLKSPDPLTGDYVYSVYRIAESDTLRQLFKSDPVLRQLGLKVEGWRIAVTDADLKRIRDRLSSLGYLLEAGTPSSGKTVGKKKVPLRKKTRRGRYY